MPSVRPPGSLLGYPSTTDPSKFFGNPGAGFVHGEVDRAYARVEHKTGFGLTIRNTSSWAQFERIHRARKSGARRSVRKKAPSRRTVTASICLAYARRTMSSSVARSM